MTLDLTEEDPEPVRESLPLPPRHRERPRDRDDAPGAERRTKSQPGPPMTLGGAAAASVLILGVIEKSN
jgi:hypothetical protein